MTNTLERALSSLCVVSLILLLTPSAFAACGERGGPGFRSRDGRCVGWASLGKVCGDPPTTRCTPEIVNGNAPKAASDGAEIETSKNQAHSRATALSSPK
jgi:hypothetical protein